MLALRGDALAIVGGCTLVYMAAIHTVGSLQVISPNHVLLPSASALILISGKNITRVHKKPDFVGGQLPTVRHGPFFKNIYFQKIQKVFAIFLKIRKKFEKKLLHK
jgi:hypothetical protein